jgi:hypothetical protein
MRKPTEMPEWLEKQFNYVDRTIQTWSPGKREAAGIPMSELETLKLQLLKLQEEEKKIVERIELLSNNEEILELERRLRAEEKKIQDHINENKKTTGMPLD